MSAAGDRLLRFTSPLFHLGATCSSAVVTGIVAALLYDFNGSPLSRLIYIETVAGLSLLFSAVCIVPMQVRKLWPADILFTLAWFAAFGLLMGYYQEYEDCGGSCPKARKAKAATNVVSAMDMSSAPTTPRDRRPSCVEWEMAELFAFLSGALFMASAFMGVWHCSPPGVVIERTPKRERQRHK